MNIQPIDHYYSKGNYQFIVYRGSILIYQSLNWGSKIDCNSHHLLWLSTYLVKPETVCSWRSWSLSLWHSSMACPELYSASDGSPLTALELCAHLQYKVQNCDYHTPLEYLIISMGMGLFGNLILIKCIAKITTEKQKSDQCKY